MNYHYDFIAENNTDSVILTLKRYGIALIPNYLSDNLIELLNGEFDEILVRKAASVFSQTKHPGNKDGRAARLALWHKDAIQEFPNIVRTFRDEFMREIAEAYYAPHAIDFNDEVFITHELPDVTPTLPWHFDRIQALKFWFNLTETTKQDGAFEYCPGTHWEGRYRAGYHLSQGLGVQEIPNDIDEQLIRDPVTLELNAGDLLIFDPDGFHRSSQVLEGGEQRVLRAHTHPSGGRRYRDKPFSAGWWARSMFNINRWMGQTNSRILGDAMRDCTLNRDQHASPKDVNH